MSVDAGVVMPVLARAVTAMVLSAADGRWAATLIERSRTEPPTPSELTAAARVLDRARTACERAGIEVPAAPQAVEHTAPAPRKTAGAPEATMRLRADGRIAVKAPFRLKSVIKGLPGARFDPEAKTWHIPRSAACAASALAALTAGCRRVEVSPKVRELAQEMHELPARRAMLDPAEPVPEVDEDRCAMTVPLWDHQRRAVAYYAEATAGLMAVPMGGGKTIATIATMNYANDERVIIVCPKNVRGVWRREFASKSARAWHVVDGTRPAKVRREGSRKRIDLSVADRVREMDETLFDCGCPAAHAVIINYDVLPDELVTDWRPARLLDRIVYDEGHKNKNHKATNRNRKTEVVTYTTSGVAATWVAFSRRRLELTGTPVAQTPMDLYGQFRALDPGIFGTVWERSAEALAKDPSLPPGFKDRYGVPHPKIVGSIRKDKFNDLDDLAARFRSITYRPTVDLKTPGVVSQTFHVELDASTRRVYDEVAATFTADLTEFAGDPARTTSKTIMTALLRLQQLASGVLVEPEVREERDGVEVVVKPERHIRVWDTGPKGDRPSPKGEALIEALDEVGCTAEHVIPEPVVVFCRFRSDLDQCREIAERRGLRYGELSGRRRDAIDDETSLMNPVIDVAGVQIQAGGVGIELTRSSVVVWWSVGYSLVDYDQAGKRLDRPGQVNVVRSIHLLADDTADVATYQALDARRSTVAEVFARAGFTDPTAVGRMVDAAQAGAQDGENVDGMDGVEFEEVDASGRVVRAVTVPWLDAFTGRTVEIMPGVPV